MKLLGDVWLVVKIVIFMGIVVWASIKLYEVLT